MIVWYPTRALDWLLKGHARLKEWQAWFHILVFYYSANVSAESGGSISCWLREASPMPLACILCGLVTQWWHTVDLINKCGSRRITLTGNPGLVLVLKQWLDAWAWQSEQWNESRWTPVKETALLESMGQLILLWGRLCSLWYFQW